MKTWAPAAELGSQWALLPGAPITAHVPYHCTTIGTLRGGSERRAAGPLSVRFRSDPIGSSNVRIGWKPDVTLGRLIYIVADNSGWHVWIEAHGHLPH